MPVDVYTHGHADAVLRSHRWRTAENSAGYLLPHLSPDNSVLDIGCGPGTITIDLAHRTPRGTVIGLDRSANVIEEARNTAEGADVPHAAFVVGDVYDLDYDDDTFDVVHAHQVLQHLSDPVAALKEMRRVCRPDGIVAARDSDYAGFLWWPALPELDEWLTLYRDVARGNGAQPDAGRRLPEWARQAGFSDVRVTASAWCFTTKQDRSWWANLWADRITSSALADQAKQRRLATTQDLNRLADGWRLWAAHDGASFLTPHVEILCTPR
ncbi:MAG TPA: methyltransferase domain-containing protein [Nocardioidaceae bacterium]|nr:methyltransferase domain-containing protein [Nocardioidaceae bacterium]